MFFFVLAINSNKLSHKSTRWEAQEIIDIHKFSFLQMIFWFGLKNKRRRICARWAA